MVFLVQGTRLKRIKLKVKQNNIRFVELGNIDT